jgi:hypothetical protein
MPFGTMGCIRGVLFGSMGQIREVPLRPIPPKDIPLIRPDFKCTEIVIYYEIAPSRYTTTLMYKATLSFQKEWPYKRGTTVKYKIITT